MKKFYLLLSLLVAALVSCETSVEDLDYDITDVQGIGSGTEADPYLISTAEQLRELSANVKAGISYEGEYFKMTNDIDLGGIDSDGNGIAENEFTAIGHYTSYSDYSYFMGTFDGNGHEVSGLYINQPEADYQGLFGCIEGATIKNLGVSGSVTGLSIVGSVVGLAHSTSTVNDCYNTGEVSGESNYVGGVVGSALYSTVSDCYNTGAVSGEGSYVGGVVGSASSTVSNCYNTGGVSGSGYVGGVVGHASSTVSNCYNTGVVSGESDYVGGVVGTAHASTVSNCYNTGGVSGSNYSVGGVVGSAYSSTVSNCYNTGEVSGSSSVGGVVGYAYSSTVSNCYNTGEVSGSSRVGGVVGHTYSSATVSDCVYDSSVYTGSAIGVNEGTSTNVSGSATLTATMTSGNFAATLNGEQSPAPWTEDYAVKINGGYPILSWQ